MKTIIFLIFLFPSICLGQEQKTLAKFIITESTLNGNDNTQFDIDRGGYFVFYENEYKKLCFANYAKNWDQQSYGELHNFESETLPETETTYKAHIFKYRWKYYNSYDTKTGYATIRMTKIYKPQGVVFTLKMILPNLDILEYTGYMEGSLDFNNYR